MDQQNTAAHSGDQLPDFLSTEQAAQALGASRVTVWRACQRHPGFGWRVGGFYKIPRSHVEAIRSGQSPADIAKAVRERGAIAA
jgi:excisionase family DNA binding protein